MTQTEYPKDFLDRLKAVTKTRARRVIDHILEHGFVTTEELRTQYGYHHPPRGARDVREEGIPLETYRVRDAGGRSIGAYRFGDPATLRRDRVGGRTAFSKAFKQKLLEASGSKCYVCVQAYELRYLQIDHRAPYEVSGDSESSERKPEDYMLLCGSCNRAKSWSCEHCPNWLEEKSADICSTCYWGSPESYKHIALRQSRRLDIVWIDEEVELYDRLRKRADEIGRPMPDFVKAVLASRLRIE